MSSCLSCGKELKQGFFAKNTDVPYPSNPNVCFACGMDGKTGEEVSNEESSLREGESPRDDRSNPDKDQSIPSGADKALITEPPPLTEQSRVSESAGSANNIGEFSEPSDTTGAEISDKRNLTGADTPSARQANQRVQVLDASSGAISLLETVNTINAICGAVIVLILIVGGLVSGQIFLGLVGAVVMALVTAVVWAINKVFLGIARDVREIRISSGRTEN